MDKKRRLLDALAPLEIPFEKKQDFVNILMENTNKGKREYVYYSGTLRDFAEGVAMASIIKANMNGDIVFKPSGVFWSTDANRDIIIGAGFDTSMKMTSWDDSSELITVGDVIAEPSKDWTQITEEEFYKIPCLFTYQDNTYEYEEGQTWGEWVNSSYNTIGAYVDVPKGLSEEFIMRDSNLIILEQNTYIWVKPSDLIQPIVYSYGGATPM